MTYVGLIGMCILVTSYSTLGTAAVDDCRAGWPIVDRAGPDSSGWTMVSPDQKLSCSGHVERWTYQGKASQPFRAIIFRPIEGSVTEFKIVGINDIPAGASNAAVIHVVPELERITVEDGDVIGWSFGAGVLTYNGGRGDYNVRWLSGNLYAGLDVDQILNINTGVQEREYSIEAQVSTPRDIENPTITCPRNITTSTGDQSLNPVTWNDPEVMDNVDADLVANCTPSSGSSFEVGSSNVICYATDAVGNEGNCSFFVNVQETDFIFCGVNNVSTNDDDSNTTVADNCDTAKGLLQSLNKIEVTEDNVDDVANTLANITSNTDDLDKDSIFAVSDILKDIVGLGVADQSITSNIVDVVDNVIESGLFITDRSLMETGSSIVTSLESQLSTVAAAGMNFTAVHYHISVMTLTVSSDSLQDGLTYPSLSDCGSTEESRASCGVQSFFQNTASNGMAISSIFLPPEIINLNQNQTGQDEVRFYFTIYHNNSLLISNFTNVSAENVTHTILGSDVISATVVAVDVDELVNPVTAVFPINEDVLESPNNIQCVYWDFTLENGIGDWSNEGCTFNGTVDGGAICLCDHLTNFAILIDYYEPKEPSKLQDALSTISLIGCIVSIVCLTATVTTFILFKQLRKKRPQKILLNLSLSLLLLYLVFAIGIDKTESIMECTAFAVLIHYFTLVSVFWMSIEAVNMYLVLVKVFYDSIHYFLLKSCAIGYGIPLGIVVICLGIDSSQYSHGNYCFIQSGNVRNFGLILVIAILQLLNGFTFILVLRTITCRRHIISTVSKSNEQQIKNRLINAFAVSVLLGLTWVFGFLAIGSNSAVRDVFQTLFSIFNSLQGLFIFILFCVRQKDVRDAWKWFCKGGDRARRQINAVSSDKEIVTENMSMTPKSTKKNHTEN